MSFDDPQFKIFVIMGMVCLYNAFESMFDGGKIGVNIVSTTISNACRY